MLQKLIDTLKDAKEKAPYHVHFHVKDNTWEVWEIGEQTRAIIINASHEEAENICEEYINKFIVKKLVEVLKEPTEEILKAGDYWCDQMSMAEYNNEAVWIVMLNAIFK